MKANDIIDEGIGDWISKAKDWYSQIKTKKADVQAEKDMDRTIRTTLDRAIYPEWRQFFAVQDAETKAKVENLANLLVGWANNRFKEKVTQTKVAAPVIKAANDSKAMYQYLYDRIKEVYFPKDLPAASISQQSQAATTATQAAPTVQSTVAQVQPGYRIRIVSPLNKGVYFKTNKGWTNEIGQPVTDTGTISSLDRVADSSGRLEPIPTLAPVPQPIQRSKKRRQARESLELTNLSEGGNAIPEAEPVNKEDVPGVVKHAKKLLPSELLKGLQVDIGSAGFKKVPAGDIDLMIEADDMVEFYNTSSDKDPVKSAKKALSTYLIERGYSSNVQGRNVHVGIPYTQQATGAKKVAQVDYMAIHEAAVVAPWHQHGPRGMYADPDFKGNELFMLISSIAKHLNLKFDPFAAKLTSRDTGETVGRTRQEVAKILLNPRAQESDLDSVKSIMRALETDPDREGKLAQARQDAAKGLLKLSEAVTPGTAAWFNDRVNRLL